MGFFKDFKEDLSQAVNELSDDAMKFAGQSDDSISDDMMVNTLEEDIVAEPAKETKSKTKTKKVTAPVEEIAEETIEEPAIDLSVFDTPEEIVEETVEVATDEFFEEPVNIEPVIEETVVEELAIEEPVKAMADNEESNETAIITPGLIINGDITSSGSIELLGKVNGNVTCKGKLVVSGSITGNTSSKEFFADKAQITGDISCDGPAKIGNGSVIIGNLNATSAVIAGAIKGDIDVHGPVIVDTTAIVMGNLKSKSAQINNGAVIEGYFSQCYSNNSPKNFFGEE